MQLKKDPGDWIGEAVMALLIGPVLAILLALFFFGILLPILTLRLFYRCSLYLVIWCEWVPRGKRILLVTSNSAKWKKDIQETVWVPISDQAILLNWSERRSWPRFSLESLVYRHFGGARNARPLILIF